MLLDLILVFTGDTDRRYRVKVISANGTIDVHIPLRGYSALADLALARLQEPNNGASGLPSIAGKPFNRTSAIADIRSAFHEAFGDAQLGHRLILNLYWGRYTLCVAADAIWIEPAFRRLAPHDLSETVVAGIMSRARCRTNSTLCADALHSSHCLRVAGHSLSLAKGGFSNPFIQPDVMATHVRFPGHVLPPLSGPMSMIATEPRET